MSRVAFVKVLAIIQNSTKFPQLAFPPRRIPISNHLGLHNLVVHNRVNYMYVFAFRLISCTNLRRIDTNLLRSTISIFEPFARIPHRLPSPHRDRAFRRIAIERFAASIITNVIFSWDIASKRPTTSEKSFLVPSKAAKYSRRAASQDMGRRFWCRVSKY